MRSVTLERAGEVSPATRIGYKDVRYTVYYFFFCAHIPQLNFLVLVVFKFLCFSLCFWGWGEVEINYRS